MPARARCKLIVVEGIPGSGKSSMASCARDWLAARGLPTHLYLEGNPDHPADYESVAYFTRPDWASFLAAYPGWRDWLEQNVVEKGDDLLIGYHPSRLPDDERLFTGLAQHDVYEILQPETYRRLALDRWREFTAEAAKGHGIWIFECCLMQNPLAVLTLKHNRPVPETLAHIRRALTLLEPLQPALVYLSQCDPRRTLERAAAQRPPAWVEFLIDYTAAGGWAADNGVLGFDSVLAYYEQRQAAELAFLRTLSLPVRVVEETTPDYARAQQQVAELLSTLFES